MTWLKLALGAVLVLAVGVGVGWGLKTVLQPPSEVLQERAYTLTETSSGEVGDELRLNTAAVWRAQPVARNQAVGTLTSIDISPDQSAGNGARAYTVDGRAVSIAQGDVPMYREIKEKDKGEDVRQLQVMLGALGYYHGRADGEVGSGTVDGIKAWQKALGVDDNGVVGQGDIVFVPTLPARMSIAGDGLTVGSSLNGGEEIINALPTAPRFALRVTSEQAEMIATGTAVKISHEDQVWEGVVGQRNDQADAETIELAVVGADDKPVCGDQCATLSTQSETLLDTVVELVEPVQGVTVPDAAISTDASGEQYVTDESGVKHSVTVKASARGMSVIDGVDEGIRVRLPGEQG
ncbi:MULTISPECIES: peptidoglycan-binding domain-containing protein [Auritidibacter]|uniref:Peptidoglycan-binding domain-containing protein n=1 Tax=Auritidibacter ignavus TaxID=678932 RepID=A0AAJ6DC27_9MICC|nr:MULTISPECIES: peptidoglycan-binding protein [Auritidibacter]PXA77374.1 hypothetical protein DCC24_03410 [Auritidibacter sp. NML100628]WGH83904.1 peptidoglycan-binding domain-containing protein [Auritidibacter ignavus]WGH93225.1 peptidoglycan-binding domain-containing protein [Auritidibacter ignavus]